MVKIHGIIYLIMGVVVTIASKYVKGMQVFFYVGILFIIVGVAKLVFNFITRDKKQATLKQQPFQQRTVQSQQRHQQMQFTRQQYQQKGVQYCCQRCGSAAGALFNFCSQCGMRLR